MRPVTHHLLCPSSAREASTNIEPTAHLLQISKERSLCFDPLGMVVLCPNLGNMRERAQQTWPELYPEAVRPDAQRSPLIISCVSREIMCCSACGVSACVCVSQFVGKVPPAPPVRTTLFFFAGSLGETASRTAEYSLVSKRRQAGHSGIKQHKPCGFRRASDNDSPRVAQGVRQRIYRLFHNKNISGFVITRHVESVVESMRQSIFCLAPAGFGWCVSSRAIPPRENCAEYAVMMLPTVVSALPLPLAANARVCPVPSVQGLPHCRVHRGGVHSGHCPGWRLSAWARRAPI